MQHAGHPVFFHAGFASETGPSGLALLGGSCGTALDTGPVLVKGSGSPSGGHPSRGLSSGSDAANAAGGGA